jgi:putative oxidoreductase
MTLGNHLLRTTVGALFVGHGTQKLFGWMGGHGPDGTGQFFESLGLRPGRQHAIAAGAAEAGGGALLIAGAGPPIGEAALTGTLITAIRHAHADKGPWVTDGGFEYPAVLLAAIFAVTEQRCGLRWALAQLAAGSAASLAISEYSRRQGGHGGAGLDGTPATSYNGDAPQPEKAEMAATAPAGGS